MDQTCPTMSYKSQRVPRSTSSVVADVFRKLNDPRLVASFQKLCGVEFVTPKQTPAPSAESASHDQEHSESDTLPSTPSQALPSRRKNIPKSENHNEKDDDEKLNATTDKSTKPSCDQTTTAVNDNKKTEVDYVFKYPLLHYLFEFGASLGNELFYISFFPWWFWNIDGYVGRRVCTFWAIFMYVGQATKDIVKWPRPASPPVVRMEKRYALEYGMPSTHAMVGAGLPFSILILTYERYEYPFYLGVITSVIWCCLVCASRIYLGMHTVLDVLAGLAYVFGLMLICLPFLDTIDHFVLTYSYSPAVCIVIAFLLCICYPTLDRWSTARGDTTLIMAVEVGLSIGHWVGYQYGFMQRASTPPPYQIIYPTWGWFGLMLLRLVLGVVILIATRAIMKLLSYNLLCYLTGATKEDRQSKQKLSIELPYKFLTYSTVAFNSVYIAPLVFRYLGIERETYFTEI